MLSPFFQNSFRENTFPDPSTIDIWMSYLGLFPLPETGKTPLMLMADPFVVESDWRVGIGRAIKSIRTAGANCICRLGRLFADSHQFNPGGAA